jgi:hypothetical protein
VCFGWSQKRQTTAATPEGMCAAGHLCSRQYASAEHDQQALTGGGVTVCLYMTYDMTVCRGPWAWRAIYATTRLEVVRSLLLPTMVVSVIINHVRGGVMKVSKLVGSCDDGDCPTIYTTDRGTVVVQGDHVGRADGLKLGDGEGAVEIPLELLREALSALGR